jgi:hypothetical protein
VVGQSCGNIVNCRKYLQNKTASEDSKTPCTNYLALPQSVFDLSISKTTILAVKGKELIWTKIVANNNTVEQVGNFNYL